MLHRYVIENDIIRESSNDGCRWCRISEPRSEEISEAAEEFGFDATKLVAALDADEPSQFNYEGGIIYLLIDIPFRTADGSFNTTPMMIAVSDTCVITVCGNDQHVIDRIVSKPLMEKTPSSSRGLTVRMLLSVIREYQLNLKEIDSKRKSMEASIRNDPSNKDILTLHELENSLVYFTTSLKSLKLLLDQIQNVHHGGVDVSNDILFKKIIVETEQAIEMATIYREILNSSRNLASTMINNKLNDTMKWLTCATVVLTIPMIITGAYGMNVDLPLQGKGYAFLVICGFTVAVCSIGMLLLRRKRIL